MIDPEYIAKYLEELRCYSPAYWLMQSSKLDWKDQVINPLPGKTQEDVDRPVRITFSTKMVPVRPLKD